MERRRLLAVGVLSLSALVSVPSVSRAQAAPSAKAQGENTPEAVFQKATAALQAFRLADFAGAMDPAALKQFQSSILELADHAKSKGKEDQILSMFANAKTFDDLKKLPPDKFLSALYEGMSGRSPAAKQLIMESQNAVIGHVNDPIDRSRVYVVYKTTLKGKGEDSARFNVANLRTVDGRWRMLLGGELEGLATALKQGMEGPLQAFPRPETVKVEPLGHMLDKDETAHVVYRVTTPVRESKIAMYRVFTLKKAEEGWKEVRDGDIPKTEELIRSSLGLEVSKAPAPDSVPQRKPTLPKAKAKASRVR